MATAAKTPELTPEQVAEMRETLAAHDRAENLKQNEASFATLAPLVGVLDGKPLADALAAIRKQLPLITDRRILVHLNGVVDTGEAAIGVFNGIKGAYEAAKNDPANPPA